MKNPYDETCRGQFISRRFWFISRRFWPFQCFFLSGARFPLCAGVGVGHFFVAWVRRSHAMKTITMKHVGANSYPEGSGSYPEGWPRSDPVRCACLHMRSTISWWAQHFVTWYSGCFDASQCQGCANITQCQKSWHGQHFVSCLKSGRSVANSKYSSCV